MQGRAFEYNGPREKANIVQFMRQQNQPPSKEVATPSALANSLDRLEATVLGLFNEKSDLFEEFMVAANEMRGSYRWLKFLVVGTDHAFDFDYENDPYNDLDHNNDYNHALDQAIDHD